MHTLTPMLAALALMSITPAASARADDPTPGKIIPAAEARAHLDERCTVELTVRLSKHVPDKVYFLDSEADYKDPKNVAVVIDQEDVESFRKAGIDDPCVYYKGNTIRVPGTLIFESQQVRIRVDDPKQIEVVEKKG